MGKEINEQDCDIRQFRFRQRHGNGWVSMRYIEDRVRGKGYGSSLLEHVERLCNKEKLFTSTNLSNLRMQRLLEKREFVISGVIHNLDESDPEVVYFKKIKIENPEVDTAAVSAPRLSSRITSTMAGK